VQLAAARDVSSTPWWGSTHLHDVELFRDLPRCDLDAAWATDSPLKWLLDHFSELQAFMVRAAAAGHGVIIDVA
jgi:hypothetical protein